MESSTSLVRLVKPSSVIIHFAGNQWGNYANSNLTEAVLREHLGVPFKNEQLQDFREPCLPLSDTPLYFICRMRMPMPDRRADGDMPYIADTIMLYRPKAIRRGRSLFCSPLPLFLLHAHAIDDEVVMASIAIAIDDGYGDPIDLDPVDEAQTARLEAALLERSPSFAMSELFTIDYAWPRGRQVALCRAIYGEAGEVLLLHDADEVPAFQVFAAGPLDDLLVHVCEEPDVLLPCSRHDDAEVARVVVRRALPWRRSDINRVIRALTGTTICDAQICRTELLLPDK